MKVGDDKEEDDRNKQNVTWIEVEVAVAEEKIMAGRRKLNHWIYTLE